MALESKLLDLILASAVLLSVSVKEGILNYRLLRLRAALSAGQGLTLSYGFSDQLISFCGAELLTPRPV
jgi:hypothetical protein